MKNIILIGMPSSGKSTVGVVIAKYLGMDFADTDVVLQTQQNRQLQDIINKDGIDRFLEIEESTILSLNCQNTVLATGGSAVYSEKAMNSLKRNGIVIYLNIDMKAVNKRLKNIKTRGVVLSPGETLEKIYRKRKPLYERYADITIDSSEKTIDETIDSILERLASLS
ncbi:shikimate kinase [Ruminiclostridium sufflavum DSM 19573]|uniref:Shikimate kinase n=1 Tax=Ruminiclostridium sufflavum DSM 19573 TaxID=1121337 RepID=A0A318XPR7_9FIRM|nr:shikimate kinase [Ruminiclostridium sufflavum]PYG88145.1 shikimate kinase [Ruminiclostridium sufflavum DSM 19573]